MGRPKRFDPDRALDQALATFWLRGYEGTSLDDLTLAMGLGRASLYNAFGDKHALFLRALDRYCASALTQLQQVLESSPAVRASITAVFRGTVEMLWSDPSRRGCLLVNSTTERAAIDPTVAMRAAEGFERLTSEFRSALERGQRSGELQPHLDVRATARYLASALNGLRLLAKMTDRQVADDIVKVTLATLN
jgi:TetR/AcrR family transcriptional repressor of nem operon